MTRSNPEAVLGAPLMKSTSVEILQVVLRVQAFLGPEKCLADELHYKSAIHPIAMFAMPEDQLCWGELWRHLCRSDPETVPGTPPYNVYKIIAYVALIKLFIH